MEINVSWCDLITENGVEALTRGCNKLKRFSSKGCKQVNNNAVICLASYCKSLEVLNLHSCDVSVVCSAGLFAMFAFSISIAITKIWHVFNFVSHFQTITDLSIQKIAETCLHLQKLCVSKCAELTDHTLISLAQHNPYLNTIEVAGCHQFTDLGFQALGKVRIHPSADWTITINRLISIFIAELQVFGTNGLGGMQSNHWFNIGTFGNWLSEPREIGKRRWKKLFVKTHLNVELHCRHYHIASW